MSKQIDHTPAKSVDKHGHEIRVGNIVVEENGIVGRVVAVHREGVLFRAFKGQKLGDGETQGDACANCIVLDEGEVGDIEPAPESAEEPIPDLAAIRERCEEFEEIHDELVLLIDRIGRALNSDFPTCNGGYGPGVDAGSLVNDLFIVRSGIATTIGEFKAEIALLKNRKANAA